MCLCLDHGYIFECVREMFSLVKGAVACCPKSISQYVQLLLCYICGEVFQIHSFGSIAHFQWFFDTWEC